MHILNYYFTPFAVILVLFAVYFLEPDERGIAWASFAILAVSSFLNYWFAKNTYRFMRWSQNIRTIMVLLNLATSAVLFYLLGPYWAPMWLLFLIAPAAAAMFMKRSGVFAIAFMSAGLMLGTYYLRSVTLDLSMGEKVWAMASVHALFVIFFSMFVSAMSEMIIKVRDSLR